MEERVKAVLMQLAMRGWSQFALATLVITTVTVGIIALAAIGFFIWVAISFVVGPEPAAIGLLLAGAILGLGWLERETMPVDPRKKKE